MQERSIDFFIKLICLFYLVKIICVELPTLLPPGGLASIMGQLEGTTRSNKKGDAEKGAQGFGSNNSGKGPQNFNNYN